MRTAFFRKVALAGSSWRALSVSFAALTRPQWERVMIASGRELGLITLR